MQQQATQQQQQPPNNKQQPVTGASPSSAGITNLGGAISTGSSSSSSSRRVMVKSLGRYIQLKEKHIGSGAYADVYEGYNQDTKEKVAIKVIQRNKLHDRLIQNLESEITVMKRIKSDYVIKLFEVHRSKRNYYLILELCSGGELAKFLKKGKLPKEVMNTYGGIKESIVKKFILHLSKGLKHMHEQNLIHRDLKPANLLFSRPFQIINKDKQDLTYNDVDFGFLKIADFGFAREIGPNDLAQTLCGTPLYMAPEILSGQKYNIKADLWSLGAIIYEMLFGRPPYMAANQFDLLNQIKKSPPNYPSTNAPFSQGVIDMLKGLLQCEPTYRMNFEQFYNHYYLKSIREEFGDKEEFNATIVPTVEPIVEPVVNPNVDISPQLIENVPIVQEPILVEPMVEPLVSPVKPIIQEPTPEPIIEFPIIVATKKDDILEEVPLDVEKINTGKLFISNPSEENSTPTQPSGGNVVIIMDHRIPSDEAFKKTKEYSLDSVIGTNPTVIFDFSNLSCGEECRTMLVQVEKQAKLAWFISETGLVMEKNFKYSEAYALYVRASMLIRGCLTILSENNQYNDRTQAFTFLLRDWLGDFFTHCEAVHGKIVTKEVDVNNIIYQMAIEIAKEAAHKEYLGSKECIGLYVRAKHFLTYLMEESFSDKKKFSDFVESFTARISSLEEQYAKANNL